jgi:NADP-dependent 3-hydroxy acid dehydrogenase YdfG
MRAPPPRVVAITGASQGIGAAFARHFAKELPGARLALVARNEAKLQTVARACRKAGAAAVEVFPCDVADEAAVGAMANAVLARFGRVDVLINNAGKFEPGAFSAMNGAQFDRMIAANLRSVFLVARAFAPGMAARGWGDIFNVSSVAGLQAYPGGAGYCAAKFGVTGLSKVLRAELRDKGVRVCTVFPGATDSPAWEGSGVPRERMMPAEDLARMVLAICQLSRRTVVEEITLRPQLGDL